MQTAIAGLRVSVQRFGVAADNIANVGSTGRVEPYDGYVPQRLVQSTGASGAPQARVRPFDNPAFPAYAPADRSANADGVVGMPNVNLPAQFVELSVAQRSYEANVAVLETTNDLMKFLVDREI
ncbi:MAG: flagellar biosynthesis protein FlgC [Rhodospirillaceae bacterium]|nr:flagellar biosynthesis protein FlgC [Rhodospirillaceae bacterium]